MLNKAQLLRKAEFNPRLKTYLNMYGAFILFISLITIPILPLWFLIAPFFINRYYEHLECELTTRSLRFKKGYIIKTEKTIPLDKIQDITFKEGPLLNKLGLSILKIETAGNSGAGTADMSLIGIVEAQEFRQMVYDQRDVVPNSITSSGNNHGDEDMIEVLKDIRASLKEIESKMK